MTNKKRAKKKVKKKEDIAMIMVRISLNSRRKLKMIAAYENSSMNDKTKDYIEKGIKREEKIIDNIEAN